MKQELRHRLEFVWWITTMLSPILVGAVLGVLSLFMDEDDLPDTAWTVAIPLALFYGGLLPWGVWQATKVIRREVKSRRK